MEKAPRILKSQKGDTLFFIFIIVFVILTLSAIIIEYFRIDSLYQQVEYELQRGVNSAVEYAILDEYRRDDAAKMDTAIAEQELYDYFSQNMKLDQELNKYSDNRFVYQLKIRTVSAAETPPRLTIEGWLKTRSIFSFLSGEIRLPFTISSSNSRIN
ncbi:hypothetical protein UF75_3456 [Desulfosporosinus sp. I2]|uniref:hypothetical protein n=1 Tax=Desulfosporosinus sp. I2 TaxID=1617025 RepID=UPI0005EFDC7A|nr:hypothetical protein [Desulfosporosinus sp. I2]KJR46169.1 hypothetical protein UF75_3456 [Desulfosporosinus sp. I2]